MIKIKYTFTALLLTILFGTTKLYSQTVLTTTEEEYNYVTKGYQVQIESGLDMKKGYTFKDLGYWSLKYDDGSRGFSFKGLYRGADTKPCAIMAIYQKKDGEKITYKEYYCIPTMTAESLWDRTLAQINASFEKTNASQIYASMIWALMKLSSQEVAK